MRWGGLRWKLMGLILLLFLPLVGVVFLQAHKQRLRGHEELTEGVIRVARLVATNRQQSVEFMRTLLITLSQTQGIISPERHDCRPLVKQLQKESAILANVGACDKEGVIYCSAITLPPGTSLKDRGAFRRAMETGDFAIGQSYGEQKGGERTWLMVYAVINERGEKQGAVFLTIDLLQTSWFRNTEFALSEGSSIAIIDSNGRYLLHSGDAEKLVGKSSQKEGLIAALQPGQKEAIYTVKRDGREYLNAIEQIGPLDGGFQLYASVEVDSADLDTEITRRLYDELRFIGLIAAAALAAAWFLGSRWIVRPARHLVKVAREISNGNLEARSNLPEGDGEFGEIGHAFNQMTERLHGRIVDLKRTKGELQLIRDELETRVVQRTAELQGARERLEDAIENVGAGFAMFDAAGVLQVCNALYKQAFGPEASLLVKEGLGYKDVLRIYGEKGGVVDGGPLSQEWLKNRYHYFLTGEGPPVEEHLRDRWVRTSIRKMRGGGAVVLLTDITALKTATESLLLRNRAIAALNCGVIVTNPHLPDNPIVDVNPAFERITGYELREVIGRNGRFLQGEETDPAVAAQLEEAFSMAKEIQIVFKNYRKDGTAFWNELKISPVLDEQETLIYFVGVVTDVTKREESTSALEYAAEELRRSNADLEQFAYTASHDLQEPLRMVASYTQLLARRYGDKLDRDAKDFIGYAVSGAQRMQSFIEDLLKYSRLGTEKRPFEPVELGRLVGEVLENFRLTLEEIKGEVVIGPLPIVNGDKVQLGQLFQNFISNAVKFRSDRPLRIEINAIARVGEWEFTVQDNGIGFEQADSERIFLIFQRLHPKNKATGTGMGLVICKKIVERHGGRIWTESEVDKGSSFHFTLASSPPLPEAIGGEL